jgi:hypothetical protein
MADETNGVRKLPKVGLEAHIRGVRTSLVIRWIVGAWMRMEPDVCQDTRERQSYETDDA